MKTKGIIKSKENKRKILNNGFCNLKIFTKMEKMKFGMTIDERIINFILKVLLFLLNVPKKII